MIKFAMTRDINGYNGFGLDFTTENYNVILADSVPQSIDVPLNNKKWIAIFSYEPGSLVWVANNDTAAIPTGTFAKSTSQLNPVARIVKTGDALSFVTNNTNADVSVSFYAL